MTWAEVLVLALSYTTIIALAIVAWVRDRLDEKRNECCCTCAGEDSSPPHSP